jgi:hypothetical protein
MDDSPSSSSTPTKSAYSTDPTLYLYTSLTAGSSHIITATSRIETILKANKIPFRGLDVATDEKARMLWGRRAGKRKLPGLVKMGMVVGVGPVLLLHGYELIAGSPGLTSPSTRAIYRISKRSKIGTNMVSSTKR